MHSSPLKTMPHPGSPRETGNASGRATIAAAPAMTPAFVPVRVTATGTAAALRRPPIADPTATVPQRPMNAPRVCPWVPPVFDPLITPLLAAVAVALFLTAGCGSQGGEVADEQGQRIVPLFDSRPSPADRRGTVILTPRDPVLARSRGTWTVTYTAEEPGIEVGGFVIFQVSPFWGWTHPQTQSPRYPGYVQVGCSAGDEGLEISTLQFHRVLVVLKGRGLAPGERMSFTYTDAVVDKYAEAEEVFQILVDADGDGHAATVPDCPTLRILPRPAVRLEVNVPCQAMPGEMIEVSVIPLDGMGNWALLPAGASCYVDVLRGSERLAALTIEAHRQPAGNDAIAEDDRAGGQIWRAACTLPEGEGVYFFEARALATASPPAAPQRNGVGPGGRVGPLDPEAAAAELKESMAGTPPLEGRSNPLLCRRGERRLHLFFGDIHGHSRLSDGTGTPEDYYRFARHVSGLDICALTDHDAYGTFPIQGQPWQRIVAATAAAHEPGRFVTFLGYEWTSWEYGHRNVYFSGDRGEIFSNLAEASRTPERLWRCLAPYEAMTIAHHTGGGPVAVDWSHAPGSQEPVVEICSIHGSSQSYGCRSAIYRPVEGAFVYDALERDYLLGIIGSGDTHDGHPGQRSAGAVTGGLFGVFAAALTREAVWEALRKRHVYGTSGKKIILFARVADAPMGSKVTWSRGTVPVAIRVVGCDVLQSVEVVRNGETVFSHPCGNEIEVSLLAEDMEPQPGTSWYLVKATQKDGHMAWSSPVWVTCERGTR